MPAVVPYSRFRVLVKLPALVRKQRRLESKIAPSLPFIEPEKACRQEIDLLLVKAGLGQGDAVSCLGYDVTHRGRKGQTSIDQVRLVAELVKLGLSPEVSAAAIVTASVTGDPSVWAEVKPSKGAKVRGFRR